MAGIRLQQDTWRGPGNHNGSSAVCCMMCSCIHVTLQEARLAQQLGWSQYQVHKWFWKARNYKKPSTLTKFKESRLIYMTLCEVNAQCAPNHWFLSFSWKVMFYSGATLYGFAILVKVIICLILLHEQLWSEKNIHFYRSPVSGAKGNATGIIRTA